MERSKSRSKVRKAKQRLKAVECKRILKSNLDDCRAALQQEKKACELLSRYVCLIIVISGSLTGCQSQALAGCDLASARAKCFAVPWLWVDCSNEMYSIS